MTPNAKDEALGIYAKLSQADEVSKEDRKAMTSSFIQNRIAFYEYLLLKINYLKGLVKDDMQKQL